MPHPPIDPTVRFAQFVDKSGVCYLWTGGTDSHGYGRFYAGPERGTIPAHVFAWEQANGRRVKPGMDVCHHCDTPSCVTSRCLFEGTRAENMQDMAAKVRGAQGEAAPWHRLSDEQVIEIRTRYAGGEPSTRLSEEYGVHRATIGGIVRGERWRHIGGPITRKSGFGSRTKKTTTDRRDKSWLAETP